jgi:hypothetical protein
LQRSAHPFSIDHVQKTLFYNPVPILSHLGHIYRKSPALCGAFPVYCTVPWGIEQEGGRGNSSFPVEESSESLRTEGS